MVKVDNAIDAVSGTLSSKGNVSLSIVQAVTLVKTTTEKHLLGHRPVAWDEKPEQAETLLNSHKLCWHGVHVDNKTI